MMSARAKGEVNQSEVAGSWEFDMACEITYWRD